MFLRNDSDQMPSSSPRDTTAQTPSRSSNKLLRAIRRKPNTPPPTASPPASKIPWLKPPHRAFVVGINEYKAQGITDLRGCREDANSVVRFLTEELGMERERILLLTSPADEPSHLATRAAIIEGLRAILNQTPAGEEALFYYSGHGSTSRLAQKISFGQPTGNTLVPSDARQNGVLDIMTHELRYLIAESIEKRKIRFTMITDACHSGQLMRCGGRCRSIKPNKVPRDLESLLDGKIDYQRLAKLYDGRTLPYTLIAACLPNQLSYEIRENGKVRGAMTYTMLEVLKKANAALTYEELGRTMRASIPQYPHNRKQSPNIVGEQNRLIFGTDQIVRPQALFVVQKVFRDNRIRVEASKLGELREGNILTSFADWSLTQKVGQWEVIKQLQERQGLFTTIATKIWGADAKAAQPLLLEDWLAHPTVYFHPNAEPVALAWRERRGPKRVYLHEIAINDAHVTVQAVETEWVVRQADGNILMCQPQTRYGAEQIARLIDQVVSYKDFEALLSPPKQELNALQTPPEVNLTATLLDYVEEKESSLAVGSQKVEPFPYWQRAEICLKLSNPSAERLYVYPYLLDPERYEARCLLSSNEEGELAAGETRTIFSPVNHDTLSLHLKLLVSRHPLVLQLSPDHSQLARIETLRQKINTLRLQQKSKNSQIESQISQIQWQLSQIEFRVSATLPFMPQLTDWHIQPLLVSYDKEASVRVLDKSNIRQYYRPANHKSPSHTKKRVIVSTQAKTSEEISPPTIFFDPNASDVAWLWRKTGMEGVRRMLYLAETADRDVADYTIKAEGNVWVTRRQASRGSEIQALRRELALGRQVAELIDQVACYEQFESLVPMPDDQLSMPLLGEEAGVKLVAELRHKKEYLPLVVGIEKLAPLPAERHHARIIVQNQSNMVLYVYLYRLEPRRHLAELIWPSDGSAQLAAGESSSAFFRVEPKILNEFYLPLKLIVSREPLALPKWPCSRRGTDCRKVYRGYKFTIRSFLKPRIIGWGVQQLLLSCDPQAKSGIRAR